MNKLTTLVITALLLAPLAALPAGALAAERVRVSAGSGAGDAASNKKASSNGMTTVAAGGLPIILSAPHGGRAAIPGVPVRTGDGVARFNPRTDTNTDILTEKLADALEQKLGKRPFVVIARFHRKYIDVNRRPQDAFESVQARPTYEAYHAAIASARKEVTARWGRGIVLDIHGQASQPGVVFRGTQNGKTVTHLLSRSGREAVYGETGLFGQLAKQGFAVFPPVGSSAPESLNYTGGHIVGTHGSRSGGTIDAIQLELGTKYRDSKAIGEVAEKLANAITAFAKSYLPAEEQKPVDSDMSKQTGVLDTKHWNRGKGTVDIELTPAGREILRTTNQKLPIHYAHGPLLAPPNRPEIEDYEELAKFKTEIAKNGAPAGVMIGTTAIARGRFGQGRVICFSPHPELTAGLEAFVQDAIDYVKRKPEGGQTRQLNLHPFPSIR
jgi:N-formylglutamate amidohydrolase